MNVIEEQKLRDGKARLLELDKNSKDRKVDGYAYQVSTTIAGKRSRKFYKYGDIDSAREHYAKVIEAEAETTKEDSRAINDSQLLEEASRGKKALAAHGKTIKDAVAFYLTHLEKLESHGSTTVAQLVKKFLNGKEGNVRPRTYDDLNSRLGIFEKKYADTPLSTITPENIRAWLKELGLAPQTTINFWRVLHNFFNYGIELDLIDSNPVRKAFRPRDPKRSKVILHADEVATLLHKSPAEIQPALVLMTFCGIRTEEVTKLDWADIDWDDSTIELGEEVAKTNKERHVTIPANAVAWLKPLKKRRGAIADYGSSHIFMRAFKAARDAAGLTDWHNDTLRKTFISHHYGTHENAALTVKEAGNSHGIMEKHYKKPMKKKEAEKLWKVTPDKLVKISEEVA
jgi:integrase